MARAIDADIFIRDLTAMKKMYDAIELDGMIKALKEAPTIDPVKHGYVLSGVLDQVRWERDVAIEQLNSYGVQLGEKAELKRVRHGEWVDRMCRDWRCSECGGEICKFRHVDGYTRDDKPKYCPDCGARMDGE